MSLEILGEGFDLHGGGDDLVFPHHENERAQAEAAGHPFARHWIHSGMVEVGGEKMSKSLGNFTTLADALDAHGAARVPARGAAGALPHARPSSARPSCSRRPRRSTGSTRWSAGPTARGIDRDAAPDDGDRRRAFRAAMDDDFGTPAAVAAIFDAVKRANVAIDAGDTGRRRVAGRHGARARRRARARGRQCGAAGDDDAEIDALVAARDAARAAKDFAEADRIRDELAAPRHHARGHRRRHHLASMSGDPMTGPRRRRDDGGLGGDQVEGRNAVARAARGRGAGASASSGSCRGGDDADAIDEIARARRRGAASGSGRSTPAQLDAKARTEAPQGVLARADPIARRRRRRPARPRPTRSSSRSTASPTRGNLGAVAAGRRDRRRHRRRAAPAPQRPPHARRR